MLVRPTNSPPTWNNSHKTCCGLPISAGCFLPWSDYRGRTEPQCAYEGWGGTLFVGLFSRDSSLIWEESAFHLQEMCFQTQEHNKSYWQINTKKKIDVSLSCLWCCSFFFEKVGKERITSNELKNRNRDFQSDSASLREQSAPWDHWPGICIIFIQHLEMLHLANTKWATAKQLGELIRGINDTLPF